MTAAPTLDPDTSQVARNAPWWSWLGSDGALLVASASVSGFVAAAAAVPQGWLADELMRNPAYAPLRTLHRLGLTDPATSPWFWAAALAWLGALLLHMARPRAPDASEPTEAELRIRAPDEGLERCLRWARSLGGASPQVRHVGLRSMLQVPSNERTWLLQSGLWLTFVAAAFALRPAAPEQSMVQAQLVVQDRVDGSVGRFNLTEGEPIQFFGKPGEHRVVQYVPDKDSLGPAVRMARFDESRGEQTRFWLYRDAPAGFDSRVRQDALVMRLVSAEVVPRPGSGLAAQPASWLLLLALTVAGLGWASLGRTDRWELELEGDRVRVRVWGPQPEGSLERRLPSLATLLAS